MGREDARVRARALPRVLPTVVVVLLLLGALAAVSPAFRHQIRLSASRQSQDYVALSFGTVPAGTVDTCAGTATQVRVVFDVASHLDRSRSADYDLVVNGITHHGSVTLTPGRVVRTTRVVHRPAGRGFDLVVSLPDLGQQVHVRCRRFVA